MQIHAGPVFALARIQDNVFEGSFPQSSSILKGIQFGANTCRACIRTRANTGKYSWRIIYVLVSCQGVLQKLLFKKNCFGTIKFVVKKYKTSSLQSKFLRMLSCKYGQTSGGNLRKTMFWWNHVCSTYKDHYKNTCSKELLCNNFGQDGKTPQTATLQVEDLSKRALQGPTHLGPIQKRDSG